MSLTTNLTGRLRNTHLAKSHALFPFFEAVVNSIHAIEERSDLLISDGKVEIKLKREPSQKRLTNAQESREFDISPAFYEFIISDNGIGFTKARVCGHLIL